MHSLEWDSVNDTTKLQYLTLLLGLKLNTQSSSGDFKIYLCIQKQTPSVQYHFKDVCKVGIDCYNYDCCSGKAIVIVHSFFCSRIKSSTQRFHSVAMRTDAGVRVQVNSVAVNLQPSPTESNQSVHNRVICYWVALQHSFDAGVVQPATVQVTWHVPLGGEARWTAMDTLHRWLWCRVAKTILSLLGQFRLRWAACQFIEGQIRLDIVIYSNWPLNHPFFGHFS